MLWFFERDEESLRIETRFDNDTEEFVVLVHWRDRPKQIERFQDAESCRTWLTTFETQLESEGWKTGRSPRVLGSGWPRSLRRKPQ
jgi:hypothetical protein